LAHSKKCWVVLSQFRGKIWTNSNIELKISFKNTTFDPKLVIE